jgi:RimJ/RimL family protein N-acetyltransferase
MTAPVEIRPFSADEADAFRALRLEALAAHPEAFGSSVAEESRLAMETVRGRLSGGHTFGAFAADGPVGMAGFFQETGEKRRHKGMLWGVYVRAGWRGRGIAGRLVDRVVAHAAGRVEVLHLSVVADNPPARRLYEGRGFAAYGLEERGLKLGGRYVDELLMARFLR